MRKLRTWDPVMVIAGKYKGKISAIQKIMDNYAIVKWVNEMKKAMKWKWFIKKTLPIHISNIMYYVESKKKPSKIKIMIDKNGKKTRQTRKFGITI